ncbi:hypothetical protein [Azospirillum sp. B510]|nr:hypothetical protein [Azospirillum sp. B510]
MTRVFRDMPAFMVVPAAEAPFDSMDPGAQAQRFGWPDPGVSFN